MTTDPFTEAAREEFYRVWHSPIHDHSQIGMAIHMAEWARTHLTAQEPTDAEVLAALNAHGVVMSPKMHPAPSLDYWGDKSAEAMRAALTAARAARRDEE